MPKVTSFVTLLDGNEMLSVDNVVNIRVFSFTPFNLPAHVNGPGIMFFRLKATGTCSFKLGLNGALVVSHLATTTVTRSYHEALSSSQLSASDNKLVLTLNQVGDEAGEIIISDVSILYTIEV
jgi:hypothetical protein